MKVKKIHIPIYFGKLVIIKAKNWDKINSKFDFNVTKGTAAIAFKRENKKGFTRYYFCSIADFDASIIAHESVHICNYIFKDRGVELDLTNDEPQAYLTGWIFKQINQFYKK